MNPFLTIWFAPRATVRHLVETNPALHARWLSVLSAFFIVLDWAAALGLGVYITPIGVFVLALIAAPLGIPSLTWGARLLRWCGAKLDGTATALEVTPSLAWSMLPFIVCDAVLWPAQLALSGGAAVSRAPVMNIPVGASLPLSDVFTPFTVVTVVLQLVALVWSTVIGLTTLAEVHRFSIGRAFAASLMAALILFVPAVVVGVILVVALVALLMF